MSTWKHKRLREAEFRSASASKLIVAETPHGLEGGLAPSAGSARLVLWSSLVLSALLHAAVLAWPGKPVATTLGSSQQKVLSVALRDTQSSVADANSPSEKPAASEEPAPPAEDASAGPDSSPRQRIPSHPARTDNTSAEARSRGKASTPSRTPAPPRKTKPSSQQRAQSQHDSNRETAEAEAPAVDNADPARAESASAQPPSNDPSQADAGHQGTQPSDTDPATKAAEATVSPRYRAPGLDNPQPSYPRLARRRGLEGEVVLRVTVSPSGAPLAVRVLQTSGASLLDDAAREALAQWRYLPARQGERKVQGTLDVPIRFELRSG